MPGTVLGPEDPAANRVVEGSQLSGPPGGGRQKTNKNREKNTRL